MSMLKWPSMSMLEHHCDEADVRDKQTDGAAVPYGPSSRSSILNCAATLSQTRGPGNYYRVAG